MPFAEPRQMSRLWQQVDLFEQPVPPEFVQALCACDWLVPVELQS